MRNQDARQVDGPGLVAHAAGLAAKRVAEEGQPFLMRRVGGVFGLPADGGGARVLPADAGV